MFFASSVFSLSSRDLELDNMELKHKQMCLSSNVKALSLLSFLAPFHKKSGDPASRALGRNSHALLESSLERAIEDKRTADAEKGRKKEKPGDYKGSRRGS